MRQEKAQMLSGTIGMIVAAAVAGLGIWAGVALVEDAPAAAVLWFLLLAVLTVTAYLSSVVLVVRFVTASRAPIRDAPPSRERSSPVRR